MLYRMNCLVPQRNSDLRRIRELLRCQNMENRDFFRCVKVHGIRCSDSDNGFHVFYFLMLTSQECSSIDISLIRLLLPFGSIGKILSTSKKPGAYRNTTSDMQNFFSEYRKMSAYDDKLVHR